VGFIANLEYKIKKSYVKYKENNTMSSCHFENYSVLKHKETLYLKIISIILD
jgi:hypothetical protein